jgi:hypothetical protein
MAPTRVRSLEVGSRARAHSRCQKFRRRASSACLPHWLVRTADIQPAAVGTSQAARRFHRPPPSRVATDDKSALRSLRADFHQQLRKAPRRYEPRNASEVVKPPNTAEFHHRNSWIASAGVSRFGVVCQFVHRFSVLSGAVRTSLQTGPRNHPVRLLSGAGFASVPWVAKSRSAGRGREEPPRLKGSLAQLRPVRLEVMRGGTAAVRR